MNGKLSDWERAELVYYRSRGWEYETLATYYNITKRSAQRIYRQEMERSQGAAPCLKGDTA